MNLNLYKQMYRLERNNWWFQGRRQIFLDFLNQIEGEKKQRRILDVGCGTGIMLGYLARYGQVEGIDISPKAIAFCRARGFKNVRLGDAQKLPFPDSSFDIITAFDTLEHLRDDRMALKEFYRLLRPGGWLLASMPALPLIWSSHDVEHDHFRRYTVTDISQKVKQAKFELTRITYINALLFLPAFIFRGSIACLNKLGIFKGHTDLVKMPKTLNRFLAKIFGLETRFLRHLNFPLGITLLLKAEKP
jgi:ubiquinone/menaquinone biosynthesis C-methylase UbiE